MQLCFDGFMVFCCPEVYQLAVQSGCAATKLQRFASKMPKLLAESFQSMLISPQQAPHPTKHSYYRDVYLQFPFRTASLN